MAGRLLGDERKILQQILVHAGALAGDDVSERLNKNERDLLAEIEYQMRTLAAGGGVNPASLISADAANALVPGGDGKLFVPASGASYLVYTALLTQTGTNAPVATVLENTLGGTVVWTRIAAGQYRATLNNAFTENKTWLGIGNASGDPTVLIKVGISLVDLNAISVLSGDYGDSLFDETMPPNTPIEIRVYS